jgi:hypothetical protein
MEGKHKPKNIEKSRRKKNKKENQIIVSQNYTFPPERANKYRALRKVSGDRVRSVGGGGGQRV